MQQRLNHILPPKIDEPERSACRHLRNTIGSALIATLEELPGARYDKAGSTSWKDSCFPSLGCVEN